RDRKPPRHVAPDRARPHQEHLSQARGPHPWRGGVRGAAAGLDQAVTDAVAKPASTGGQGLRSRNWASRLLQYVLLQALIVIVCVFALHQPLSEPPSRYLVTAFTLEDRGATRPVTLPDFVASRSSMNDQALHLGHGNRFPRPSLRRPRSGAAPLL